VRHRSARGERAAARPDAVTDRFAGKVALVTGGAGGIGGAVVAALQREQATVAVADIRADPAVDVTDPAQVNRCVSGVIAEHGRLDCVFITSGHLSAGRVEDQSVEEFDRTISINLRGAFLVTKAAIPHLRVTRGSLIYTGSTSSLTGSRDQASYCAAKAGIANFSRAMADELAADGIRVNCVCPGWVDTPFNDPVWKTMNDDPDAQRKLLAAVPIGRQATPEEIAPAMLFLASAEASYITGATLVVDGGLVAVR
jgi:NAD(P)-dependent dehydrogenase (short-subunit alcohol dehydrogenase family)